jgi:hypothetical protein
LKEFERLRSIPCTLGYFAAKGGFLGSTARVPVLDRAIGYTVSFTVQVELKDHAGSDKNNDIIFMDYFSPGGRKTTHKG